MDMINFGSKMKRTLKLGIITLTIFMFSLTSNVFAAPPPSLMDRMRTELESVQNTILAAISAIPDGLSTASTEILNAITDLSTQLADTETTLSTQHSAIEGKTDNAINAITQTKVDTAQALIDIGLVRQKITEFETKLVTLSSNVDGIQTSLDLLGPSIAGLSSQMTTEHDDLETVLLAAINSIDGTSGQSNVISEQNGVFYTSANDKEVTIFQAFTEPTRVSLWVYGSDDGEYWEGNNGEGGFDSFRWSVKVNGRQYIASSGRDYIDLLSPYKYPSMHVGMLDTGGESSPPFAAYSKLAWLLVDDIPVVGEITVTITQTLDRANSDDISYNDPIAYQWLIG
jgi:hypothetical protein